MRRGEAHCSLVGEGSWPFCFGLKRTQRKQKSGLENFKIPIFLYITVAQDKLYKNLVPIFSRYFMKIFQESV